MSQRIINLADVELLPRLPAFAASGPAAAVFDAKTGQVGTRIGAQKLGYNITAVPPGKAAFPFHCHRINEEMFFVLQGTGDVRIGAETHPIRQGDIIACPPGGPEAAHQIRNSGNEELRYLAVSSKQSPEICEYPDSGKFGLLAEYPPWPDGKPQVFRHIGKSELAVGYWEGEGE
jgi:uncharacterized cupin superfamily protein